MYDSFIQPIQSVINSLGYSRPINLRQPPSPDLGDFCIVVNQIAGKNDPEKLSQQLLSPLQDIEGIDSVSISKVKKVVYLNFNVSDAQKLAIQVDKIKSVLKKVKSERYGFLETYAGKSVIVEHTSANPISPIHVGNLRNSVQGDTFARILHHAGYQVHRHYYVNDVGLQIGFVVVGYELATKELSMKPPIKIDLWTGQIYAIMNCFYTIQKLHAAGKERGITSTGTYSFEANDIKNLTNAIEQQLEHYKKQLDTLTNIEKPSKEEKHNIRDLKIAINKLESEISDLTKYDQTFSDLQKRFPKLFESLFIEVQKIDLAPKVSQYIKAYETNSDPDITALFREVVTWVLKAFEWTLGRYNIEFDQFDFESEVTWSGLPSKLIDQLAKTETAQVEGNAVRYSYSSEAMKQFMKATNMTKKDLPIKGQIPDLQLRRKDGTALYAAKDIAYSVKKFQDRKPDKIYNVISSEQALPQFQLLVPLHQLGMSDYAANLKHYSYELVDLQGRVMSGRLAKYITADDYFDETYIRARIAKREADSERAVPLPDSNSAWEEEDQILKAVTLASTRFPLIETSPSKRILLDLDRELDFKRNSGPFVQYAHARANSLIDKVLQEKGWKPTTRISVQLIANFDTVEIMDHLDQIDHVIDQAVLEQDPSKVANWVFSLAQMFMKYYEKYPVLKADDEKTAKARLQVISAIQTGLATGLQILGIPAAARL